MKWVSSTQTKLNSVQRVKIEKPLKHLIRFIYIKCVIYGAKPLWRMCAPMVFVSIGYKHIAKNKMYVKRLGWYWYVCDKHHNGKSCWINSYGFAFCISHSIFNISTLLYVRLKRAKHIIIHFYRRIGIHFKVMDSYLCVMREKC